MPWKKVEDFCETCGRSEFEEHIDHPFYVSPPRAFAELPVDYDAVFDVRVNFGIWHLNVLQAGALLAEDMWFQDLLPDVKAPHGFSIDEAELGDPALRAVLEPSAQRCTRDIMRAIEQGHLKSPIRDYDIRSEPILHRTFVEFYACPEWLDRCGYETDWVFDKWSDREDLVCQAVTDELHVRRASLRNHGAASFAHDETADPLDHAKHAETKAALRQAMFELKILKRDRAQAEARVPVDKPLTTRGRRTLLRIVLALCAKAKIDTRSRGAAQQIRALTEEIGLPVDDETIRSYFKEIDEIRGEADS